MLFVSPSVSVYDCQSDVLLSHSGVGDICFANQNRQGG